MPENLAQIIPKLTFLMSSLSLLRKGQQHIFLKVQIGTQFVFRLIQKVVNDKINQQLYVQHLVLVEKHLKPLVQREMQSIMVVNYARLKKRHHTPIKEMA